MGDYKSIASLEGGGEIGVTSEELVMVRTVIGREHSAGDGGSLTLILPKKESDYLLGLRHSCGEDFNAYCRKIGFHLLGFARLELGCLKVAASHPPTGVMLLTCVSECLGGLARQIRAVARVGRRACGSTHGDPSGSTSVKELIDAGRLT
jgi:hypothetical protein